jgi:conjugative transfer signal peptidase TraF
MVTFCPPQSSLFDEAKARGYIGPGFCPGGYGLLIKRVAAVAGDEVAFSDSEVRVNGELLENSRRLSVDLSGRPMPRITSCSCKLDHGQLLLMSDYNPHSFDARYFGPIDQAQIHDVIRPIITW